MLLLLIHHDNERQENVVQILDFPGKIKCAMIEDLPILHVVDHQNCRIQARPSLTIA